MGAMTSSREHGSHASTTSRPLLLLSFLAVYLCWGSTYLAIRFAITTIPPFLMAGVRFMIAGSLLYAWARLVGRAGKPSRPEWKAAWIVGAALVLGGNGLVVWAESRVPSGVTALLIGVSPIWAVLMSWLLNLGEKPGTKAAAPSLATWAALAIGFVGLAVLLNPFGSARAAGHKATPLDLDLLGATTIIIASVSWVAGSLWSKNAPKPKSTALAAAMQMMAGGVLLVATSLALGEPTTLRVSSISASSLAAMGYLIIMGSLVAYTAYNYVLNHAPAAQASTYAYVNPVVAIFLGWWLGGEAIASRQVLAAAMIVAAVVVIVSTKGARGAREVAPGEASRELGASAARPDAKAAQIECKA